MSVRKQEQDQHVREPLLDRAAQRLEELVLQYVLQELVDVLIDSLLLDLDRQFVLWKIPRKLFLVKLVLKSERGPGKIELPLIVVLLVELDVHW